MRRKTTLDYITHITSITVAHTTESLTMKFDESKSPIILPSRSPKSYILYFGEVV